MQMGNQSIASDMFGMLGSMHVPQEETCTRYKFSASETEPTQREKNESMRLSKLDLVVQTNNLTAQLKSEGRKIWAAGGVLEQPGQLSVSIQKDKKGPGMWPILNFLPIKYKTWIPSSGLKKK